MIAINPVFIMSFFPRLLEISHYRHACQRQAFSFLLADEKFPSLSLHPCMSKKILKRSRYFIRIIIENCMYLKKKKKKGKCNFPRSVFYFKFVCWINYNTVIKKSTRDESHESQNNFCILNVACKTRYPIIQLCDWIGKVLD